MNRADHDPAWRAHHRTRRRRRRRRAYIRSIHLLPTLATLGNALCGFGAIYVATLDPQNVGPDPFARLFAENRFTAAAYLIFAAMLWDAIDGRLARFTRHTTDFGGQLDSLADIISFGAAPALLALQLFKSEGPTDVPLAFSRLVWAAGAVYFACAAVRLARFNVSNKHGEQHHFSFLGLPSPGAGGAVAACVLVQQDLVGRIDALAVVGVWLMPLLLLALGLLMVSHVRYGHVVNRYLRGRRPIERLLPPVVAGLALVVAHQYTLAVGLVGYAASGFVSHVAVRARSRRAPPRALSAPDTGR